MKIKSRLVSVLLSLFMIIACIIIAKTYVPYTQQLTKVYADGNEAGELTLRFYKKTPNIPYMGMNEYYQYMRGQSLSLEENDDGTITLKNYAGEKLSCDADDGKIVIEDYARFFGYPMPIEDHAKGLKDMNSHFVRITDIEYLGDAAPVEFDFEKYGIRVYSDHNDIYLPLSILANIMADIATNHMLYNGENLYVKRLDLEGKGIEGFYDSQRLSSELLGKERPDDLIQQCYAELCFSFDYFYGHPGRLTIDEAISKKGLDKTLTSLGPEGQEIKDGLLSKDLMEYLKAMTKLYCVVLDDGHTVFLGLTEILYDPSLLAYPEIIIPLSDFLFTYIMKSTVLLHSSLYSAVSLQRNEIWGDKTYIESGNTAIIRIDSFMPDEEAWVKYYRELGSLPDDSLGIVASGLKKASENPQIKNVIFDLSCNEGGSSDTLAVMMALITGQNQLFGVNKITGQKMVVTYEADANFDGIYDEKDKAARYDFNYGVLVTNGAFSCGNLFPIVLQEAGVVIIGEPTGGGSCCVQVTTDSEGFCYMMSSAQWQLLDSQGIDVEGGCKVDIPIEPEINPVYDYLIMLGRMRGNLPDYTNYFDEKKLDELMNNWFEVEEALDDAA